MPDVTDQPAVTLGDYLHNLPQYLWPQRLLTRLTYRLTRVRLPWFKNWLIRGFIRGFQVNLAEALQPDPQAYADFNAFFTRALKPGVRPIAAGAGVVCCPVDGAVSQIGLAASEALLQAKGRTFSLTALLGGDAERARPFRDGSFVTLYLSPRDYHRIHMPLTGQLRTMIHVPGKLFSVSPLTARTVPNLFARNERVVTLFETPAGPMAVVLVGAINVASMETVWAGAITPPLGTTIREWSYPSDGQGAVRLEQGAELGRFNMGSTVILLFAKDVVRWESTMTAEATVRMGQQIGSLAVPI
ncbi:MAG: archaetidylserine decarboxylase [Candidatus Competibacter denitrificans]|jgi:phosphatidylserine decarboxylase